MNNMDNDFQENLDFYEEEQSPKKKKGGIIAVIVVSVVVILAVVIGVLVRKFVVATFVVDGISMYPTLDGGNGENLDSDPLNGDKLYLNMVAEVKRGDIVVFTSPDSWHLKDSNGNNMVLVKRVIALGGDHLQIIDNKVFLNGKLLDESYINSKDVTYSDLDVTVPDGFVFCMGDNRGHSSDCRTYGVFNTDRIIGKCFLIKSTDGKLHSVRK